MHNKKGGGLKRLALLAIALAGIFTFIWYGNNVIDVDNITVEGSRLPRGFDGFRVAVVADVQGREFGSGSRDLLRAVKNARPDIITVNGDLIDASEEMGMVEPLVLGLLEIAPVFYVTGNHEWAIPQTYELMELLRELGVRVLENEFFTLEQNGDFIVLAGVHDPNGPYDMKTPAQLVSEIRDAYGNDAYILMLAHRNNQIEMWSGLGVDTVIVGHGHGGVIRLPFVGGLIDTNRELFPKYVSGLYEMGDTRMLVSRGLGNSVVDFRLFNRPHVPVAVLQSS